MRKLFICDVGIQWLVTFYVDLAGEVRVIDLINCVRPLNNIQKTRDFDLLHNNHKYVFGVIKAHLEDKPWECIQQV